MTMISRALSTLLLCLLLSACAFAQDRVEESYTLHGDGACDTALTITTDAPLSLAVQYAGSERLFAAGSLEAGEVFETHLPTGRTDYILTVSHEGAAWSYDLRVDCPPTPDPAETDEASHSVEEYLTQRGIDPTAGRVVTMVPVQTPP